MAFLTCEPCGNSGCLPILTFPATEADCPICDGQSWNLFFEQLAFGIYLCVVHSWISRKLPIWQRPPREAVLSRFPYYAGASVYGARPTRWERPPSPVKESA